MTQFNFNDDPGEYESRFRKAKIVVTDYEQDQCEGSGDAVVLQHDGTVFYLNLSHCSCYGPWEDQAESFASWPSLDALLEAAQSATCPVPKNLLDKLVEMVRET